MKSKITIWQRMNKTKNYARFTGAVLFLMGLLGFAFRSGSSLPDAYLAVFVLLGFWGIIVSLTDAR